MLQVLAVGRRVWFASRERVITTPVYVLVKVPGVRAASAVHMSSNQFPFKGSLKYVRSRSACLWSSTRAR